MTYYALAGSFTTAGTSPDGDTIRFRPNTPRNLDALKRSRPTEPRAQASGPTQTIAVRLEGIDAPELHYEQLRQRRAATARTRLLHRLGLRDFPLAGDTILPDYRGASRGWVIAKEIDLHGRMIGLVYRASDLPLENDAPIALDRATLLRSANADMLRSGAAYHLAYSTLEPAIRNELRALATAARKHRLGVWSHDSTREFPFKGLASICERGRLVFPKLFRRCVMFCREQSSRFVAKDFVRWLRSNREHDDAVVIDGRKARMSDLLTGGRELVRCGTDPMGIVFVPKG